MDQEEVIRAVDEGDHAQLAAIIASGADLNRFRPIGEYCDTALMAAVRKGDHVATEMLITGGAKLEIENCTTALIIAVEN